MLSDLEEIDNADEPRSTGKLRRDIGEGDLEDPRHENLAGRERISAADFHVWSLPETNGGGDLALANAIAERSDELHGLGPNAGIPTNASHAPPEEGGGDYGGR